MSRALERGEGGCGARSDMEGPCSTKQDSVFLDVTDLPRNHETILCHCELAAAKNVVCHHLAAKHLTSLTSTTQRGMRDKSTQSPHTQETGGRV